MLLLGIESSTPRSSVALVDHERIRASATLGNDRRHGEFLAEAVRFCLGQAEVTAADVTGVAVGTGPGLFTGLRVGIAFAQAFAAARRLPTVGLSGLDVVAFRSRAVRLLVYVVLDARRSEVFWASYRAVPGGVQRLSDLRVSAPSVLAAEIESAGQECLALGDGARRYRQQLADVGAEIGDLGSAAPIASDLAQLALPRFVREETQRPGDLRPVYLRHADARIGWETRGRLRGGATA